MCPYIIREIIGDHVREHGYYQLDEMAYDLTHDFANADIEVITRPVYNVVMESGERLSDVDDETVFKMLSAGLPVKYVENARDGYIMYSRPEFKPVINDKKVGGITRANKSTATECWSYPHPIKSDAPLCGYDFKSEYILKVKTINKVEHRFELRYYELDKRGYEHALKDVTSMYESHNNNWTETQSLFDAQFLHQDDNGEISQLYRFNFFLR